LTLAKSAPLTFSSSALLKTTTTSSSVVAAKMSLDGIEGLNSKHLAIGSAPPPKLASGKMRLYSMRFCPYVERVMIALYVKKIPFEVININLQDKPEWYFETNPLGKVPSLEYDGKIIYESLVCVDYLDETFTTGKPILPKDTFERAKQRMLVERLSVLASGLYGWHRNPLDPTAVGKVTEVLGLYEKLLQGAYFAGANPGYVDYMVWPWVERLSAAEILSESHLSITSDKYPKLAAYIDHMRSLPEIKAFLLSGSTHVKFIKSRLEGKVNYDID